MSAPIPEDYADVYYNLTHPDRRSSGVVAAHVMIEAIERIAALEAQNRQLREVLTIMHEAMDDKKGGTWIKARKWLDERNIYHGDLQENAVLAEVCRVALAATEPKPGSE